MGVPAGRRGGFPPAISGVPRDVAATVVLSGERRNLWDLRTSQEFESMPQGKIKWFDNKKGYGFITIDGMEDIFVHYSQIEGQGFKTLRDGEAVECDVVQGSKGLYAEKVRRLEPVA